MTTMEQLTEQDLATTQIAMSCTLSPIKHVVCDLSSIIGNYVEQMLLAFYPKIVGKRANIVITELVNNVLENKLNPDSALGVDVEIDAEQLVIRIKNEVPQEVYDEVKQHIDEINGTDDLRAMLKATIKARRKQRAKGGLGLMRLTLENKFKLSADYQQGYMVVATTLALGGIDR